jgi:hypothetical protein
MACLMVAGWTWVIAWVAHGEFPCWALFIAAIGGFALGMQLMIAVYEDQQGKVHRRTQPHPGARLRVVRAASGA